MCVSALPCLGTYLMFSKTRQFLKCRRIQGPIWGLDSNRHHFAGADLRGGTYIISTVKQVQIRQEHRTKYEYYFTCCTGTHM